MRNNSLLRNLGDEIRDRRKRRDLSQEALAYEAGIHTNVIGRLERGIYNPSVLTLHSIAVALGANLHELFAAADRRN